MRKDHKNVPSGEFVLGSGDICLR